LLTLRAVDRLSRADVVVWAGSLVSSDVLMHCRSDATILDSKSMTLEQVTGAFAEHPDARIARLQSGDPAWFSTVGEQIAWCLAHGRQFEVVPGVSSIGAAASAAGVELTVPGVSQSVVVTRLARRTAASLGPGDDVAAYAARGGVMVLLLSTGDPRRLQATLLDVSSAYSADTPALIASRVSWPDEELIWTSVGRLAEDLVAHSITTSALVLVGQALRSGSPTHRSHVYDPAYTHSHRLGHTPA
jgi:precorrin-4 methylase